MNKIKFFSLMSLFYLLVGCQTPTKPIVHFSSENTISLKYSAYDIVPTVSAEAIDMAIKHCAKYGKGMKYVQGTAANMYSTQELHTFMCE